MTEKLNKFFSDGLVKLNRKQTKVTLTAKSKLFGWGARIVEFGIPLSYIAYKYGLFTTENKPYSITGGTFFAGIIAYAVFQNLIKSKVKQFNDESSDTLKRAKWVGIWTTSALVVWVGSVFLSALLMLFLVSGLGVGASLILWRPYDMAIAEKKDLDDILVKQVGQDKLQALKTISIAKNEKKQL